MTYILQWDHVLVMSNYDAKYEDHRSSSYQSNTIYDRPTCAKQYTPHWNEKEQQNVHQM